MTLIIAATLTWYVCAGLLPESLPGKVMHRVGDCAAPRLAAYAFHEGRKVALGI